MNLQSLKKQVNNQKGRSFRGKIAKNLTTFHKNKPNLKNIKIGVSPFMTSKYEISPAGSGEKQTQFKPISNPIPEKPKINIRNAITMTYKKFPRLPAKKQSQTNPNKAKVTNNQSSLIDNQLRRCPVEDFVELFHAGSYFLYCRRMNRYN